MAFTDLAPLVTLLSVHIIALMSPGPDFALVVDHARRYGRKTGLTIAFGLSIGILLHSIFSLTGASLLIQQQPMIFSLLQLSGGSYLMWLGGKGLYSLFKVSAQHSAHSNDSLTLPPSRYAFITGLTTSLLNPKALIFFLSLLSTLIPPDITITTKVSVVGALWFTSLLWFGALAWILTKAKSQQVLQRFSVYIDGICALIFTLIGGSLWWNWLQSLNWAL